MSSQERGRPERACRAVLDPLVEILGRSPTEMPEWRSRWTSLCRARGEVDHGKCRYAANVPQFPFPATGQTGPDMPTREAPVDTAIKITDDREKSPTFPHFAPFRIMPPGILLESLGPARPPLFTVPWVLPRRAGSRPCEGSRWGGGLSGGLGYGPVQSRFDAGQRRNAASHAAHDKQLSLIESNTSKLATWSAKRRLLAEYRGREKC